jgi:hypothetical protein
MLLESSRSIYKSKRYNLIFETPNTSTEGSEIFIFLYCYLNPIKGIIDINLCKEFYSCDLSKCLLNKRERISILLCNYIQLPIIYVEAKTSTRLLYK